MQPLKAVLFDLDGTLIYSISHIVDCWQHTVRTCLGREMPREEILPTLGRSLPECFEEIAPGRSAELREVYRAYQRSTHDTAVTLVPDTHKALTQLRDSGLALGVVTSKGIEVATEGLDLFDLAPYFNIMVTHDDSTRHKPYPDPLLVAAGQLDIEASQMLYVGDAVVDIKAGKAAGMLTAGVLWGAGTRQELAAAAPDYLLESMDRLLEIVSLHAVAAT